MKNISMTKFKNDEYKIYNVLIIFQIHIAFLIQMLLISMIKITINYSKNEKNIATLLKIYYY